MSKTPWEEIQGLFWNGIDKAAENEQGKSCKRKMNPRKELTLGAGSGIWGKQSNA